MALSRLTYSRPFPCRGTHCACKSLYLTPDESIGDKLIMLEGRRRQKAVDSGLEEGSNVCLKPEALPSGAEVQLVLVSERKRVVPFVIRGGAAATNHFLTLKQTMALVNA